MKANSIMFALFFFLVAIADGAYAIGRTAEPPKGLVELQQACAKALEAAQKGDAAAALEQTKAGRKIAIDSFKERNNMPMEVGSQTTKKALSELDAGNLPGAITELEHCKSKMDSEVEYYKKEGKL